nr:hypothetical protein [Desulfobacterales bacterium]
MRIEGLQIEGFGIFSDFTLQGLAPGFTILSGKNEAGKSTLLAFIQRVLFGFPDGRSKENLYPPLNGGRHGGRLYLLDDHGKRYIVERFSGPKGGLLRLTLPDNSEGGASDLERLLGHASRDLFKNVFGFGLNELQDLESMNSKEVKSRIYSAGLGTGGVSIIEVEGYIEKEKAKLFKQRGSAQLIPKLFVELEALQLRLRQLQKIPEEYDELQYRLDTLSREITEHQARRLEIDRALKHVHDLKRAWPDWTELVLAENALKELPCVSSFPSDGVRRLNRLNEKVEEEANKIDEIREAISQKEVAYKELRVDKQLLENGKVIEELRRGLVHYKSACESIPSLVTELRSIKQGLADDLRSIGPDWDEERLRGFDSSIPVREEIRVYKDRIVLARNELIEARRNRSSAEQRLNESKEVFDKVKEELQHFKIPITSEDEIKDRRNRVRLIRTKLPSIRETRLFSQHLSSRRADLQAQIARLNEQKGNGILTIFPSVLSCLVTFVFLLWYFLVDHSPFILGMSVITGISSAVLLVLHFWLKAKEAKRLDELEKSKQNLLATIERVDTEMRENSIRLSQAEVELLDLAKGLGMNGIPQEDVIERLDSEFEHQLEGLRRWKAWQIKLKEKEVDLERARNKVIDAVRNVDEKEQSVKVIEDEFKTRLRQLNLPEILSPDGAIETFSKIESGRNTLRALEMLQKRLTELELYKKRYEEKALKVFSAINRPVTDKSFMSNDVEHLVSKYEDSKKKEEGRKALLRSLEEDRKKKEKIEKRLMELMREKKGLLDRAHASNEDDFLRKGEIFRQRQELKKIIEQKKAAIVRICGPGESYKLFCEELSRANPDALRVREQELDSGLQQVERELQKITEERGRVQERLQALETQDELSQLRARSMILHETLKEHAREWCILTITQTLLRLARERYELERQPGVVKQAEAYFRSITKGRYTRLISPMNESRIEVLTPDGVRKQVDQLSRGTQEQLYLSLRFGLINEFAEKAVSLPVIMDDILVNFDPDRALSAARAILELSRLHQVIFFTCHPETVALFRKHDTSVPILSINANLERIVER